MRREQNIQLFEDKRIRTAWDEEKEEWYFPVADAVSVLTDQPDARQGSTYWTVSKKRLNGVEFNQECRTAPAGCDRPAEGAVSDTTEKSKDKETQRTKVFRGANTVRKQLGEKARRDFFDKLKRAALGGRLFG